MFIDSGYFIAFADVRDSNHRAAVELSKKLSSGDFGALCTSDYIFDEVVTCILTRAKSSARAIEFGNRILNSEVKLLNLSSEVFDASWRLFQQRKNLSFTDCTTVEAMKANGIKNLITFDRGFNQFRKEVNIIK